MMLHRRPSALVLPGRPPSLSVIATVVLSGFGLFVAVVTYRLFNLILGSVPSLLANRLLHPSLAR